MIVWEDDFCATLAERGLWVVRFDNRDVGRSPQIDWKPPADAGAAVAERKKGDRIPRAPAQGHGRRRGRTDGCARRCARPCPGSSMGGMIAQEVAIHWPERVRSLTSISSTTGDPRLPPPTPAVMAVFTKPPPKTADEYVEANVAAWLIFRGPGYPEDEKRDRQRAMRAARRGFNPEGGQRQMLAFYASGAARRRCRASPRRRW